MGIMDKLSSGLDKVQQEAEKAVEQGRYKVGELQAERQMDQVARKLGYLVFEGQKPGAAVDAERQQELMDELSELEKQVAKAKEEAESRKQAVESKYAEEKAEQETGMDETAIGPEEVTGVDLPQQAEERLDSD